jgi:hypothetical protein
LFHFKFVDLLLALFLDKRVFQLAVKNMQIT